MLSSTLFVQYAHIANFKVDFHNLHIHAKKDARGIWHKFPYLVVEEDIVWVVSKWPRDWLTPSDASIGTGTHVEGSTMQTMAVEKKKESQKVGTQEKALQKKKLLQGRKNQRPRKKKQQRKRLCRRPPLTSTSQTLSEKT